MTIIERISSVNRKMIALGEGSYLVFLFCLIPYCLLLFVLVTGMAVFEVVVGVCKAVYAGETSGLWIELRDLCKLLLEFWYSDWSPFSHLTPGRWRQWRARQMLANLTS